MHDRKLKILLGQINPIVGDVEFNTNIIMEIIQKNQNVDIIVFPEMALVGYPLMDHILDPLIKQKNLDAIERIKNLNSKYNGYRSDNWIKVKTFTSKIVRFDGYENNKDKSITAFNLHLLLLF